MPAKPAYTIQDQITLLKDRGMLFRDEPSAHLILKNISYYRLKGYWWDMQEDFKAHTFKPNSYFEDVVAYYNFDRHLRLILFDAIERIEISLRTKMIYHLSLEHGGLWYSNPQLFETKSENYQTTLETLKKEFNRSHEIFIQDHRKRYPSQDAEAWKILEIASLGTLSKLYKNLNNELKEKGIIAKEMGLKLHSDLSSCLEAITYMRNIIAHHSRLWNRKISIKPLIKKPRDHDSWLINPLEPTQRNKPFLIISSLVYLYNYIEPHRLKNKILTLFNHHPEIPIYKLGFTDNWREHPLWRE